MRIKILIVLSLVALVHSLTYDGILALSWTTGFCSFEVQNKRQGCDASKLALWDSQSHTIHGIWPSLTSTVKFGAFDVRLFDKNAKLLDDMNNYWPPKIKASNTATFLWQHEWDKHGKDYAAIIYKLRPTEFAGTVQERNNKLQIAFFTETIAFYKRYRVQKLSAATYTKASLASALGLAENQIALACLSSNLVREIYICFQITNKGLMAKTCTKSSSTCSSTTIQYGGWKDKGQSRVTNYANSFNLLTE